MIFEPQPIAGCYLIKPDLKTDERGFFARTFCEEEFAAHKLHQHYPQSNISFNTHKGTFRGMHFQIAPYEEVKVVRCTQGMIYDVILDLRRDSETYLRWIGIELSANSRAAVYIPSGCAHGFQTLVDESEVLYLMGALFNANANTGVRWDDPAFDLRLPLPIRVISPKDLQYAPYK